MADQLFFLSSADIFSVYPNTLNDILEKEEEKRKAAGKLAKDFLYMPSDAEWQGRVYYRLLEVQKKVNAALEGGLTFEDITRRQDKPIWDPSNVLEHVSPSISPGRYSPSSRWANRKKCIPDLPIDYIDVSLLGDWSLENITKAGKLLRKPPIPVNFDDEHEMRKVYSLIFDVFRYKHVLSQALMDVSFYAHNPEVKEHENRVWLLLFELYARNFLKRKSEEAELQKKLFKDADLEGIAEKLWNHRIRLAASISRIRIKNGALHLSQLLPVHLQNEKVAIAACNPIVSGWINPFKLKDKVLAVSCLDELGMIEIVQEDSTDEKSLKPNEYKWDKVCPLFLSCLPNDRAEFAKSDFVKNNFFVMQDRTFSIAPAILSRLLDHFELDGDIVQTHVSSPRSTAYLAALFHSVNRVHDFLAFGCGLSIHDYKKYIEHLGIKNIKLYSENFCSVSLESGVLESVVGIFATPPNSFSGVADPIDLICSRGGDLTMLEVLTESEISQDGKARVQKILEEQRETLRLAMSRPQVQFILYETHSIIGSENQDMVEKSVKIINRSAFEKHLEAYKERKRLEDLAAAEAANIPQAALGGSPRKRAGINSAREDSARARIGSRTESIDSTAVTPEPQIGSDGVLDYTGVIKVPKTDEFLVADVPDMCLNQDNCLDFNGMGCYVSLIQRKEITKLDAKYLIKMAEARGLFGKVDRKKSAKVKSAKRIEKKPEKKKLDDDNSKQKKGDIESLIKRLNQPTHASFIRSNLQKISNINKQTVKFNFMNRECARHNKHHDEYICATMSDLDTRAKRWWLETTKYINALQNIEKHQINLSVQSLNGSITKGIRIRYTTSQNIETLVKNKDLPTLKLKRTYDIPPIDNISVGVDDDGKNKRNPKNKKVPYPVTVRNLKFEDNDLKLGYFEDSGYWTV